MGRKYVSILWHLVAKRLNEATFLNIKCAFRSPMIAGAYLGFRKRGGANRDAECVEGMRFGEGHPPVIRECHKEVI